MQLWLIPLLPFAGFVINGLFGRRFSKGVVNLFAIGSVVLSFAWVLKTIFGLGDLNSPYIEHYYTWIQSGNFTLNADFAVDRLTAVMLLVVTGIGSLIHIYSIGYMAHEHGPNFGGYYRFFAYLNLFMFFMLVLVLGANFLVLFVGWEGVGLCSYLLIGFYFDKKFATDAGNKAFIVNRIGDFGFSLAMFYIFKTFGSLDFATVFQKAPGASEATLTLIGLLLMVGAAGKSAQLPLYVWLPDAMAGPTPVSALIHAATMVTAGVYLFSRVGFLLVLEPTAMAVVALIGAATALYSAVIAFGQDDIKKILAYSTISQLGFMFMGVGLAVFWAAILHLVTHAFFKACLFLGAGSVMHGNAEETDIKRLGGLRRQMPWTWATFAIATLAITGIVPLSGFFSKDAILHGVHGTDLQGYPWVSNTAWLIGLCAAFCTAFYMVRLYVLVFEGKRSPEARTAKAHESDGPMRLPMVVLAALSVLGVVYGIPLIAPASGGPAQTVMENYLSTVAAVPQQLARIHHTLRQGHESSLLVAWAQAWVIAIAGGGLAGFLYLRYFPSRPKLQVPAFARTFERWVRHGFYVDQLYNFAIVKPTEFLSYVLYK